MGGAAGHMKHPYEDGDITFGEMEELILVAMGGEFSGPVTEKVDGQNLFVTWKKDHLLSARNKGHLKNRGENAMDTQMIKEKFSDHSKEVREAFTRAHIELEDAMMGIAPPILEQLFREGRRFLNVEILWPEASNILEYPDPLIVLHNFCTVGDPGDIISDDKADAFRFGNRLESTRWFKDIRGPVSVDIEKSKNTDLRSKLFNDIKNLRNQHSLAEWHTLNNYYEEEVLSILKKCDIDVSVVDKILDRWVYGRKSGERGLSIRDAKKLFGDNQQFYDWFYDYDKNQIDDKMRELRQPFERIFLRLGTEVLENTKGVLIDDPVRQTKTEIDIRKKIATVTEMANANMLDDKTAERLKKQAKRLLWSGGKTRITATEGIVFDWGEKTYKLTGTFAPINQLLGILKYNS
jgi:hypothetical protein